MTTSRSTAATFHAGHGSLSADDFHLSPKEADEYAVVRIRNAAFDAVHTLWLRRQAEGLTQRDLAQRLARDKGWISRAMRGPANWEFKTFARLVRALHGEAEICVSPLEEPLTGENYDAYRDFDFPDGTPKSGPIAGTAPVRRDSDGNEVYLTSALA